MALTRAQYLAPGGSTPVLSGQVQGVKTGTGISIAADGTLSFTSSSATGVVKLNPSNAYNAYQWPLTAGTSGYVLSTDGAGNLSWAPGGGGSAGVTQIIAGTNVTISPVGGTGVVTINATGGGGGGSGTVTSVDVSGGATGLTFTGGPVTTTGTITASGVLAIANGGTGATTQAASAAAILPTQSGQTGNFLTTNGSAVSWGYPLQQPEVVIPIGNTGTATTITIAAATGYFATATLNGNCTFTFATTLTGAVFFTFLLTNDATAGRTIVWPASVKWPNGGVPPTRTTAAGATDVYTFFTLNSGTTWYGNLALPNYV
jgi:hypothetical protein